MFVRAVSICLIPEYGILARAVLYGYSKKILSVNYEKAQWVTIIKMLPLATVQFSSLKPLLQNK